ncbi:Putative oxygen-independent coproporphyrinogen III oxidase [Candidatus Koribacter versatilis Ellin345]|uniref:Heme chaperone HemW n=1 Tax=Koribacter versatilis (strain Ellin345) TaxID=204669 RepID=Q1IP33_KORVE|nr:radical SAM family heme chaperone HemW [Candidatus Koribacter versatilis]ABF41367.1 Putative oxygen-independent coproporphyrinogen III oxidase [Candidatus Koribacter versatilis Ellin345]
MALGIYISVPFCRTKCSFCNFASGVFSRELFDRYINIVAEDIARAEQIAPGAQFESEVDSIYLGGGTPSVLAPDQLERLFLAVHEKFKVSNNTEVTVECAPGTLTREMLNALVDFGVNRVSLGVQSFVDEESRSVGRLHTREITFADINSLRQHGIENISVDLIAGLPHQTPKSWRESLQDVVDSQVPHVSVYMLEVDEDSRLGRELMAGGTRYHAHFVPDDDTTADLYQQACDTLNKAGVRQYEISNFARPESESRHNLKYWLRQPYLGFGVDAHSMLASQNCEGLRFSTADDLDQFLAGAPRTFRHVNRAAAEDEAFFLGLRLNRGVDLSAIEQESGKDPVARRGAALEELTEAELLQRDHCTIRLTDRGRLLSNEVFERLTLAAPPEEERRNESANPPLIAISPPPK